MVLENTILSTATAASERHRQTSPKQIMTFSRANFSRFGYYVVLYLEAVCLCVLAAHVKLEERCLRLRSHEEREVDAHKRDCVDRTVPFNETNQRTRQDKTRQDKTRGGERETRSSLRRRICEVLQQRNGCFVLLSHCSLARHSSRGARKYVYRGG